MKAIALSLDHNDPDLVRRLRQLALACAVTTGLAVLGTPVFAQSPSPPAGQTTQPAPAQPSASGAATSPATATQPGQAAQPGVRAVDATTLRMTFYTVRPADMLASNLIGLDVHNLKNEDIGEINDLVVDEGKTIRGIVIGIGGFLGIGERNTVIEPAAMVVTREAGGSLKAVVNTTREDLQKAPEFKFEGNMARRK